MMLIQLNITNMQITICYWQ